MPLRVLSYDGASYRSQLLDKKKLPRYPVITIILYYGDLEWKNAKLSDCLDIPEVLKPFFQTMKFMFLILEK